MFLDDFSKSFSFAFSPIGMRNGFYIITPENDRLKNLLQLNYYSNFDYNLDILLSKIVYYLLVNGRTYVELVSYKDQNNVVKGIEFVCIPAKCYSTRHNRYRFTAQDPKNKKIQFDIDLNRVIIFDLKDLGFHRNYFRKMINRLSEFDVTGVSELVLNPKAKRIFNFEEYQKAIEYKLLKVTQPIHWLGRNYSNQHLSESYHLYRTMQYKILRYKFLKYVLYQINMGLNNFKAEWEFSGDISISVSISHYKDAFDKYTKGEINASKLGDVIIENLVLEE